MVLKRLIDIRWSALADAVSALDSGYNEIQSALNLIANAKKRNQKRSSKPSHLLLKWINSNMLF
jgi:hypothetical protein